jgi:hypothetical protein
MTEYQHFRHCLLLPVLPEQAVSTQHWEQGAPHPQVRPVHLRLLSSAIVSIDIPTIGALRSFVCAFFSCFPVWI